MRDVYTLSEAIRNLKYHGDIAGAWLALDEDRHFATKSTSGMFSEELMCLQRHFLHSDFYLQPPNPS